MKYYIGIIAAALISSAFTLSLGYFLLKPNPGIMTTVAAGEKPAHQSLTGESQDFDARINKLQRQLDEAIDSFNQYSLFALKSNEDGISDSARVMALEKKFNDAIANVQFFLAENKEQANTANQSLQEQLEQIDQIWQTEGISDTAESPLSPTYSSGLFKDPAFVREFQKKVSDALNSIQQKQWQAQVKQINKQLQQMVNKNVESFAKKQNLTDYQKSELNKILTERNSQIVDLYSKLHNNKISPAAFIAGRKTAKNGSNDRVRQILLPEQYGQYQKFEPSLNKPTMDILKQEIPP
jgi:ribosomal protein S20